MSALLQVAMRAGLTFDDLDTVYLDQGIPYAISGNIAFEDGGTIDHYHQGLPFTAAKRLVGAVDGTVAYYGSGSAPFTAEGRLVVSSGSTTHYSTGIPYAADGGISPGGVAPAEPTVSNFTRDYGTDTTAQKGAYTVKPDNPNDTITSITIDSGNVGSVYEVGGIGQAVNSIRTAAGQVAANLALNCTANFLGGGSDTFVGTLNAIPGISVDLTTTDELVTAWASALTFGSDIIYLRGGIFNPAQADIRGKRTTPIDGVFDGTNHIIITAHVDEDPEIAHWRLDNSNDVGMEFRLTDLVFHRPSLSSGEGGDGAALQCVNGFGFDANLLINFNEIYSEPDFHGSADDLNEIVSIWSGFRSDGGNFIRLEDNYVHDTYDGLFCPSGGNVSILRNVGENFRNDVIRHGQFDNVKVNDNQFVDCWHINDLQHCDFQQMNGSAGSDGMEVLRNLYWAILHPLGAQGIFLKDSTGPMLNLVIQGNRLYGTGTNAITVQNAIGAIIQGNTALMNPDTDPGFTANFILGAASPPGVPNFQDGIVQYNITNSTIVVQTGTGNTITPNTVVLVDTDDYADMFVDPANPMLNPSPQLDIKAGSIPDLEDPKHGAHQDYYNYLLHTSNPPYNSSEDIVYFNGIDTFSVRAVTTGAVDSKIFTVYAKLYPENLGTLRDWYSGGGNDNVFRLNNSNQLVCIVHSTTGAVMNLVSGGPVPAGPINVIVTCDTNPGVDRVTMSVNSVIVKDVPVSGESGGAFADQLVEFTNKEVIGAHYSEVNLYKGGMSVLYFTTVAFYDLDLQASFDAFYDPVTGVPVLNGVAAAGDQFLGKAATWNGGVNQGTLANYVMNGAVTDLPNP